MLRRLSVFNVTILYSVQTNEPYREPGGHVPQIRFWALSERLTWLSGLILMLSLASAASGTDGPDVTLSPAEGRTSLEETSGAPADDSGVRSRGAGDLKQLRPFPIPPGVLANLPGPAPTNVTLTPVTPTNIRIEWSPSPGAVRYLISRNGAPDIPIEANAGFLQGNRSKPSNSHRDGWQCRRHEPGRREYYRKCGTIIDDRHCWI